MMVAEIVLTSLGLASLPAGIGLASGAFNAARGTEGTLVAGLCSIFFLHPVLTAIGIPLWVNGAKPAKPKRWWAAPTVLPGPRAVTLRWTLPL